MTQINPPFDGSKPCPGCNQDLRGITALLHNAYNRFPVGKYFSKLNDLVRFHEDFELTVPHPAAQAMLDVFREIKAAAANGGMWEEDRGMLIKWSPAFKEAVTNDAFYDRLCKALYDWEIVSDAHFADNRHASGRPNDLFPSEGYKFRGYGKYLLPEPRQYKYTVTQVSTGGDLIHDACGARIELHEHFKARMAADPTFYASIKCPGCHTLCPATQFRTVAQAE